MVLFFVLLIQMDPERDRKVSEHVLRMHRYRNPGEQDGEGVGVASQETAKPLSLFFFLLPSSPPFSFFSLSSSYSPLSPALPFGGFADMLGTGSFDVEEEEEEDTPIFEKHNKMLHGRDRGCVPVMFDRICCDGCSLGK